MSIKVRLVSRRWTHVDALESETKLSARPSSQAHPGVRSAPFAVPDPLVGGVFPSTRWRTVLGCRRPVLGRAHSCRSHRPGDFFLVAVLGHREPTRGRSRVHRSPI